MVYGTKFGTEFPTLLKNGVPAVYTNQHILKVFTKYLSAALESKSPLCVQSALILLRRFIWPIKIIDHFDVALFNSLTDMAIHLPIQARVENCCFCRKLEFLTKIISSNFREIWKFWAEIGILGKNRNSVQKS